MSIGILFESQEWSSFQLEKEIQNMGVPATLIDLEKDVDRQALLSHTLIVSRIFASAAFRNHHKSLAKMPEIIDLLRAHNIPMINHYEAHASEISKAYSTTKLAKHGIAVPTVYGVFDKNALLNTSALAYPCIIKPDCGGRTNATFIVHTAQELVDAMKNAPDIHYIAEAYIHPQYGYLTRIEVIDDACKLILKRSVTGNGLSAYHLGSVYTRYDDCAQTIQKTALEAMNLLSIQSGSMDIIENDSGFYIIDINSVSNASEDNTETFGFDLMKETATYAVKRYHAIQKEAKPS